VYELRSVSREDATFLQLQTGKDSGCEDVDLAILDQTSARAFSAVAKVRGCEVDLFLSGEEFRGLRENSGSGKKKITFAVLAAFYGPSQAANEVGHILSKARIYLQDPKRYRQGVSRYNNPHKLHFRDSTEIVVTHSTAPERRDQGQAVEELLKNLDHHIELRSEAPISTTVTTKLNR